MFHNLLLLISIFICICQCRAGNYKIWGQMECKNKSYGTTDDFTKIVLWEYDHYGPNDKLGDILYNNGEIFMPFKFKGDADDGFNDDFLEPQIEVQTTCGRKPPETHSCRWKWEHSGYTIIRNIGYIDLQTCTWEKVILEDIAHKVKWYSE